MHLEELLTPNSTIIPMMVIFLASFLVLDYLVFKPTQLILKERKRRSTGLSKDAHHYQEKANQKLKEYEGLMNDARSKARRARDEMLKSAQAEKRDILAGARAEAEKYLSTVKAEIARESQAALFKLRGESQALAGQMVETLLKRKVA